MMDMLDYDCREMKLVCLYHNAKEAVQNLLAFFQTTNITSIQHNQIEKLKTILTVTNPRYFKTYPTEMEKICNEMKQIKYMLLHLPNYKINSLDKSAADINANDKLGREKYESEKEMTLDEVFSFCEKGISLADFINKLPTEHRDSDYMVEDEEEEEEGECCWRCCGESSFEVYWRDFVKDIVKILSYLNAKSYHDDRVFYQRRIEMEHVIYKDNKDFLKRKYKTICLEQNYGPIQEFNDIHERYIRRSEVRYTFAFQFKLPSFEDKLNKFYWSSTDKKQQLRIYDITLRSEVSCKFTESVRNIFEDHLGDFNSDRYSVSMCRVDREYVEIQGKRPCNEATHYSCFFKSKTNTTIPSSYESCTDNNGEPLCRSYMACIEKAVKELLNLTVFVGVTEWYCENRRDNKIQTSFFLTKKGSYWKKWTVKELYDIDKAFDKAQDDFHNIQDDFCASPMRCYYTVATGKFNYVFQMTCYSPGLKDILEDCIAYAQQVVLDIQMY